MSTPSVRPLSMRPLSVRPTSERGMDFTFVHKTRIRFGRGVVGEVFREARVFGTHALLVTGTSSLGFAAGGSGSALRAAMV